MSKKDKPEDKRAADLAPGDAELWEKVAATAKPLRKGKNRAVNPPGPPVRAEPAPPPAEPGRRRKSSPSALPVVSPSEPPSAPALPLGAFNRREVRELGGGRTSVDARIDLHGLRQREAHALLKGFLARAQDRGHRYVLVITGKGGSRREEETGPGERGVLNRVVPRWLSEPEYRQWVVSFSPAHKRHGGEGALYVRMRRRKQS